MPCTYESSDQDGSWEGGEKTSSRKGQDEEEPSPVPVIQVADNQGAWVISLALARVALRGMRYLGFTHEHQVPTRQ